MRIKTRFTLVLAILLGVVGVVSTAYADNSSWIPASNWQDHTYHQLVYQDTPPIKFNYSLLQGAGPSKMVACKSVQDPACADAIQFDYNSILKVCASQTDVDCIESLGSVDSSGALVPGTFSKYNIPNHVNSFLAGPKQGIPAGDSPSIWSLPSAAHTAGTDYAVIAAEDGWVNADGSQDPRGHFLSVQVIPVYLTTFTNEDMNFQYDEPYDYCINGLQQSSTFININCSTMNQKCVLFTMDSSHCYEQADFSSPTKLAIKLRLSKEPTGWIHGRMQDPGISIATNANGSVELSVSATSTSVPMIVQGADWAQLPANLQNWWVACDKAGDECGGGGGSGANGNSDRNYWQEALTLDGSAKTHLEYSIFSSGQLALEGVSDAAPLIGNKASAMTTSWSFRTLANYEMNGANDCITKNPGLSGVVTTNSTAYSAGPPAFENGALNYKLASTHYLPDGTSPLKGVYSLVLRSDVARCIYHFSSAPISASISVLSTDGSNDVATTVSGEKNGWLSLSAANFEFSSPTIQVKLSQSAPAPSASPAPPASATSNAQTSPTKTTAKSTSIICIKGSTSKTIQGTNPKCPTGYKQIGIKK